MTDLRHQLLTTMAELNITERQLGDVTVLDMDGEIRIGDSSAALRKVVRRLVDEGKRKLVLNLAGIKYLDSSGNGELLASYTYIAKRNGQFKLVNLTDKIQDLLVITKLLTVYDVYDSVDEAVRSFSAENKYMTCPVYGCDNSIAFSPEFYPTVLCTNCRTEISVTLLPSAENNQVSVRTLVLPTYDNERIRIEVGAPTSIWIIGRLDLFASEVLERAWLTIPPPRRAIFRVETAREISPLGLQKLLAFCATTEKLGAAVILVSSKSAKALFPAGAPVYDEEHKAIAALGDISPSAKWTLTFRG